MVIPLPLILLSSDIKTILEVAKAAYKAKGNRLDTARLLTLSATRLGQNSLPKRMTLWNLECRYQQIPPPRTHFVFRVVAPATVQQPGKICCVFIFH